MPAPRSSREPDDARAPWRTGGSESQPSDWLSMQQAACELNVSVSTVRRMIRSGRLRNRMVPRRGGFAYLIYLPDSRHAAGLASHPHRDAENRPHLVLLQPRPADAEEQPRNRETEIRTLESQVQRLSEALARALRAKQRSLLAGMGAPIQGGATPYSRYRWLVGRRRWWRP